MTRAEKIAEAQRLDAEGWTHAAIGRRVGVTGSCVYKWLNPEVAREWNRRENARPERKTAKRQWERNAYQDPTYRKPCPQCGGPLGHFAWDSRETKACERCVTKRIEARWRRIEGWWAQGWTMRQIADELGWTMNHIRAEFGRMRNAGRAMPHRRTPEQCARIREARWAA